MRPITLLIAVVVCNGCGSSDRKEAEMVADMARVSMPRLYDRLHRLPTEQELRRGTEELITVPSYLKVTYEKLESDPSTISFQILVFRNGDLLYRWKDKFDSAFVTPTKKDDDTSSGNK